MNILVRRKRLSDTEGITNQVQGNQSEPLMMTVAGPPEWGGLSHLKTGGVEANGLYCDSSGFNP
jgi:hypothetical protein